MRTGVYPKKKKRINFTDYDCHKITLHLRNDMLYGWAGCGYSMLSTLTSESPWKIKKLNKDKKSCNDWFVKKYLRQHKFKLVELTKCNVSNTKEITNNITSNNLLITSQLVKKNECSWFLNWGGKYTFHNFEINKLNCLDFINFPIHTAYLVTHNKFNEKTKY